MKRIDCEEFSAENDVGADGLMTFFEVEGVKSADHSESPHFVLENIDKQLVKHGLELLLINTHSDCYAWQIIKKE